MQNEKMINDETTMHENSIGSKSFNGRIKVGVKLCNLFLLAEWPKLLDGAMMIRRQ